MSLFHAASIHKAYGVNINPLTPVPLYLTDYDLLYRQNPHQAALVWFAEAHFGLFMHYGIYSLLGRHEWVMYSEAIQIVEMER